MTGLWLSNSQPSEELLTMMQESPRHPRWAPACAVFPQVAHRGTAGEAGSLELGVEVCLLPHLEALSALQKKYQFPNVPFNLIQVNPRYFRYSNWDHCIIAELKIDTLGQQEHLVSAMLCLLCISNCN